MIAIIAFVGGVFAAVAALTLREKARRNKKAREELENKVFILRLDYDCFVSQTNNRIRDLQNKIQTDR